MKSILEQLYLPYFSNLGFFEATAPSSFKRCGLYYKLDPSVGTGYYWIFPVDNLYSISTYQFVFKDDFSLQYEHPAFLNLGYYSSSIAKLIYDVTNSQAESLLGYVGNEEWYDQTIQKDTIIYSVGISFLPEFYEKFLPDRFSKDFRELKNILPQLNGSHTIPEVAIALKQIHSSQPSPIISRMYYESKISEIIALIMQWKENQSMYSITTSIPKWELESLHEIYAYLNENYSKHIPLDTLVKISCMSHNKLTGTFKQIFGMTITERIQTLRVEKAKQILLNSDWDICKVANAVGYKQHASFSVVFKRSTGLTPNEFRRLR